MICGFIEIHVRSATLQYLNDSIDFEKFSELICQYIDSSLQAVAYIDFVKGLKEINMCPFTTPEARDKMLKFLETGIEPEAGIEPGDKCFVKYRDMMKAWTEAPRWTTAHNIYKKMRQELPTITDEDEAIAYDLAWQVFFAIHVMKYELTKRSENGEVQP
jgi:hypothetical protein